MTSRRSLPLLLLISLSILCLLSLFSAATAAKQSASDDAACAACFTILEKIEKKINATSDSLTMNVGAVGKKPFKRSEPHIFEAMDDMCKGLKNSALGTVEREYVELRRFVSMDGNLSVKNMNMSEENTATLKRVCGKLASKYEDEMVAVFKQNNNAKHLEGLCVQTKFCQNSDVLQRVQGLAPAQPAAAAVEEPTKEEL